MVDVVQLKGEMFLRGALKPEAQGKVTVHQSATTPDARLHSATLYRRRCSLTFATVIVQQNSVYSHCEFTHGVRLASSGSL